MQVRLDGKAAIVTGSSSGIGKGIALALAEAGADVTVVYFGSAERAEETAAAVREHGRKAHVVRADIADSQSVDNLVREHMAAFGRLDILVNNAAILGGGKIHEIELDEWERVVRTNLFGAFYCSRLGAREMIAGGRGGRIVNISSVHQEACWPGDGPYAVSKAGVRNLTRTQAIELGAHGITVNDVAPGLIVTEGMNKAVHDDVSLQEAAAAQIVARRVGFPADVAAMVVFLCSDAASYCTGGTYYVDGGWMLTWPPV